MRWVILSLCLAMQALPPPAHAGTIVRSRAARAEFQRLHPCPATGDRRGACPGYVVDHIRPLACGGQDRPENMQWQTRSDARAKDAWERVGCQIKTLQNVR